MQHDSTDDSARKVWLNQPTEKQMVISKLIGQRSRELRARTRKKLIGTSAGPLAASVLCAYSLQQFPAMRIVLGASFAFSIAWGLWGVYLLNRGTWSAIESGDIGPNSGLKACRLEVERQRDLVRRSLVWSFGPSLLAVAIFIVALSLVSTRERGVMPNGLPFLILMVVWIISWFVIRVREEHVLQHEIDDLNEIEFGNHG